MPREKLVKEQAKRRKELKSWIDKPFTDYLNTHQEMIVIENIGLIVLNIRDIVVFHGVKDEFTSIDRKRIIPDFDGFIYEVKDPEIFYSKHLQLGSDPSPLIATTLTFNFYVDLYGIIKSIHISSKQEPIRRLRLKERKIKAEICY